jgi:hypothetical protein
MNTSSFETLQLFNLNGKKISESKYRWHTFTNVVHRPIHILQEVMNGNMLPAFRSQKNTSYFMKYKDRRRAIAIGLWRSQARISRAERRNLRYGTHATHLHQRQLSAIPIGKMPISVIVRQREEERRRDQWEITGIRDRSSQRIQRTSQIHFLPVDSLLRLQLIPSFALGPSRRPGCRPRLVPR